MKVLKTEDRDWQGECLTRETQKIVIDGDYTHAIHDCVIFEIEVSERFFVDKDPFTTVEAGEEISYEEAALLVDVAQNDGSNDTLRGHLKKHMTDIFRGENTGDGEYFAVHRARFAIEQSGLIEAGSDDDVTGIIIAAIQEM